MGQRRCLDCTAKRHMRYFCCTEARKLQATGGHWPSCSLTTETMPSDPEIGTVHDIVEAMQSRSGVDLLVDELHCQISQYASPSSRVVLIGHSWGAWLATIYAAHYPQSLRRIILIGTPPAIT